MPRGVPAVVGTLKWCPDCAKHLPFEEFYKCERNTPHGLSDYCKKHDHKRQSKYTAHYRRKFNGVDWRRYEQMVEERGNVCDICGNPETQKYKEKVKQLAVDHCHKTGRTRGLLCAACNNGLGRFRDDPERLRRAAQYLEEGERHG